MRVLPVSYSWSVRDTRFLAFAFSFLLTPGWLHAQQGASSVAPSAAIDPLAHIQQLIGRGHATEALVELNKLVVSGPMPPGTDRLRGDALYAQAEYTTADQAFAAALVSDPADKEAAQMRGLTLFRLGRAAEAIPLLESARNTTVQTKADPNYVLALCYMETRRYDDARHAFAIQYGFAPDSAPAYLLAARMLFRREYVPIAMEYAQKAAVLEPALPLAHLLLGEIALAGQHADEAILEFQKERSGNPLEPGIYDRLGDAYLRAGRYPEAEQALQQAVLLEPNATGPYILLGKVLLKRDDPATAAGYLERAEEMDPGNYMTHGLLGQTYRMLGRTSDAAQQMQTAENLQAAATPHLGSQPTTAPGASH